MKTIMNYSLVLLSGLSVALSCSKIDTASNLDKNGTPIDGKQITINATISDALTRVEYTYDDSGTQPKLTLKWENSDILVVSNASGFVELTDPTIDETGKTAKFSGTLPEGGEPYTVSVKHAGANLGTEQTQVCDGDLRHLEYAAMATEVMEADLENLTLSQTTGVLGLIAKLPTDVSAVVKAVIFQTEKALFNGDNTLTVNLQTSGAGTDNILHVYANIAASSIPAGTEMFIRFKVGDGANDYYTRYQVFASDVSLNTGALNGLKLNCSHIDRYAGKDDDGSEAHPYLIADPYQVAAVNSLASESSIKYFKMIADVNMTGVSHNPINPDSPYDKVVNFDGNDKVISHLNTNLFYVFKGSIQNLTLSDCNVGARRGIFAEYCQGTGHTITNVDILGGRMTGASSNTGALIGNINEGSDGVRTATITDCQVTNTIVRGGAQTGGLIGNAGAIIVVENCSVSESDGSTSSVVGSGGSDNNIGGLIGYTAADVTITGCTVSGTDVTGKGVVGGVIGFANSLVTISGCKYTGGEVYATARYCGGFLGSTANVASVISDCQVENATVKSIHTDDARCGGFCGQIQTKVTLKGCSVGTSDKRVLVILETPDAEKVLNSGGFAGTSYGTVTKNGDIRTKVYVRVSSTNTSSANVLNMGGFAGYHQGVIEYCDVDADMTGQKGQYIGGFIGRNVQNGTVRHCTSNAIVTGDNYTGGFVGSVLSAGSSYNDNVASGSVSAGSTVGGFAGQVLAGSLTSCSTSCVVSGVSNIGGFAGQINGDVTVSKCSSQGTSVSASGNVCGGFAAIAANGAKISDSFSVTNLLGGTRKRGGMIGHVSEGEVSMNRCYATGSINANFELGGIVGTVSVPTFTMINCAAWNGSVAAASHAANNWSSAGIVGVADLNCTLTDNYRNPDMALTAYWGTVDYGVELTSSFQQPNVSSSSPLTDWTGATVTSGTMRPYNGKCETGKNLSQLASTTLGWSSDVWNFTGDLPTLK